MKFNIYPQEFPALSRYLLRFADSGRFRTSLSAVQSAARDVGELPASLRGAAFRQIAYAPARETQKYRIFAEKRIPMKQPDHRPWKVLSSEYLAHEPWFTVRREAVELPGGARIPSYYVLEYPDWVNVIARTDDGRFLLIDQYRHGLGRTSYEIVAGVRDPQDATPARRRTARTLRGDRIRRRRVERVHGALGQPRHPHQPHLHVPRHRACSRFRRSTSKRARTSASICSPSKRCAGCSKRTASRRP